MDTDEANHSHLVPRLTMNFTPTILIRLHGVVPRSRDSFNIIVKIISRLQNAIVLRVARISALSNQAVK
jgi:hypothetical protein